jgi:hypothetical protein
VYEGGTIGALISLGSGATSASFPAVAGTQYHIAVDGNGGTTGTFNLEHVLGVCNGLAATIMGEGSIPGTPGNDVIVGGTGTDDISGGAGNDTICGLTGTDTLDGGVDDDTLDGGAGADVFRGHGGNDNLNAQDGGADASIDCDGGAPVGAADVASVDDVDPAAANCETVTVTATGPGPGPGPDPGVQPLVASFSVAKAKLGRVIKKGLRVRYTCSMACGAKFELLMARKAARKLRIVAAKPVRIGRGSSSLTAAGTKTATVKLTKKAKRRLRKVRRIKVSLRSTFTDSAGTKTVKTKKLTLKR